MVPLYTTFYFVSPSSACVSMIPHWNPWILYSGKLSREKTFANFEVLYLFAKIFSTKLGAWCILAATTASNLRKFSPRKSYFSPIRESFLPRNFPRYTVGDKMLVPNGVRYRGVPQSLGQRSRSLDFNFRTGSLRSVEFGY